MKRALTVSLAALGLLVAGAGTAHAKKRQKTRYVQRPLTLPEMTLAPSLQFQYGKIAVGGGFGSFDAVAVNIGAKFGVTDDFTVGAMPLSLQFGDLDTDYHAFMVHALYRFTKGAVEIGVGLDAGIDNNATFHLMPALPIRIHAGKIVRIDTGIKFGMSFITKGNSDPIIGISHYDAYSAQVPGFPVVTPGASKPGIPLDVTFQLVREVYAGVNTGLLVQNLATNGDIGDTIAIPLGAHVGGTIPGKDGPLLDITGGFAFPAFLSPSSNDVVVSEIWGFGLNAVGYFYL